MRFISRYESPLGRLTLASDGDALTGLWFAGQEHDAAGLSEDAQEAELPVFTERSLQRPKPGWTPILTEGSRSSFRRSAGTAASFRPRSGTCSWRSPTVRP